MSSALAPYRPAEHENPAQWVRRVFRTFRRTRPFYGGLLAMIAGLPIMYFPYAKLSLGGMTVAMATTGGAGALIIGVLLIVLGLTAWFQPAVRIFAGIATILLTLVSIPVSNLGGFGLAILPGLIGGGLMVSWAPLPEPAAQTAAKGRRRRRGKDGAEDAAAGNAVAQSVAAEAAPAAEAEPGVEAAPAVEAPTTKLPAQAVPQQAGAVDQEEAR
ncbi:DUF6114 domain-containing protein [Streptomyces sp. FH025]|uniref:DUF6114 domain-containing protein n=1 Tax=Streptomyces sp. FH025 TaxID=2815937 RepID=UPI001A9D81C2|nr:DUF6114 domain-containing protein [Streptomyces sp. FH025]MBO1413167.1 hypothetical protein [Streptomyces sp. FH025]